MISVEKVQYAAKMLKGKVIRTPLIHSPSLSQLFGGEIYLKLENLQKTGSFKIRGATHYILTNKDRIGPGGVVAASAGNHAQGVALAARQARIPATIVMPEWASISKQEATRGYGGEIVIEGKSLGESLKKAEEMAREGKTFIHPFDDADIITGQGTIALELLEDLKEIDMIIVPIGGGGIISGIASIVKSIKPTIKVIGVQATACPSAYESYHRGKIIRVSSEFSIADGISVKQLGALNFEVIRQFVDDVVLVEEDQIAAAILLLLERKKILAEGSGAVSLAALLNGSVKIHRNNRVVLLISGGNVDSSLLGRILSQGLLKNGRIMRIRVRLSDTPGSLSQLLIIISALKANVLHIYHDRNIRNLPIYVTHVDLELETRGPEHVEEMVQKLTSAGYEFELK
ncbi:MAG: threonine ammonia-lyase [Deltaproteobacteria bacterium]|jgi:threonine dehydratase|nr:threonine ammonia-lyase [Deltaproteobacteria bacterium]